MLRLLFIISNVRGDHGALEGLIPLVDFEWGVSRGRATDNGLQTETTAHLMHPCLRPPY